MESPDRFDPERDIEPGPPARPLNPYGSPWAASEPQQISMGEPETGEQNQQPRRWWTTLAVPAVSLAAFMFTSGLMLAVALLVVHRHIDRELLTDPASYQAVSESRLGLFLVVVVPQFALLIPSLAAAAMSPVPFRRRLGFVRGQWPLWGWLAAALATPLVGLVSSLVVGSFVQESENLKMMSDIFREHGKAGFLIPLSLMIGVTPAICEELLFRGYVQQRLTRTAGPAMGILVASVLFAAFHMDLVHVIAVFPLGLFLGFITWRSGSIFPAMLGHFINNVTSVIAVVFAPQGETDVLAVPIAMVSLSVIGTGIIGLIAVVALSISYGRPPEDVA